MKTADFRAELKKIMPGYKWTVHRDGPYIYNVKNKVQALTATGIQTSGCNRISTLNVTRTEKDDQIMYKVKSAGFGKRSPWLRSSIDTTLAKALRALQKEYEWAASNYAAHARDLESGRRTS